MIGWRVIETRSSGVMLAVQLLDSISMNQRSVGQVEVTLIGCKQQAVLTPSGYYLFADVPDPVQARSCLLQVKSDYYLPLVERMPLSQSPRPSSVFLTPNPAYPFPPTMTVLRGQVLERVAQEEQPVTEVDVRVVQTFNERKFAGQLREWNRDKLYMDELEFPLQAGDRLEIQGRSAQVVAPLPRNYRQQPLHVADLAEPAIRGARAYLTESSLATRTNAKGEWAIAIPYYRTGAWKLILSKSGYITQEKQLNIMQEQNNIVGTTYVSKLSATPITH